VNFDEVETWVRAELPPPPARVLEVGAGSGELAASLSASGWDVVAIDPKADEPHVLPVALADYDAAAPFDAAVAVVSLHHVEPLEASLRHLAELLRPGAPLLVDEFDVSALDERAAAWWLEQRRAHADDWHSDHAAETPPELIASMREHVHALDDVRSALAPWFELGDPVPGTYLYRWKLGESLRGEEERLVEAGELPRTGVRFVATRRR
jgi:SAM-dependent methyltransferase